MQNLRNFQYIYNNKKEDKSWKGSSHLLTHCTEHPLLHFLITFPLGTLLMRKVAFPFTRSTDIPWKRCLMASPSSCPVCLARALLCLRASSTVMGCQPPRYSMARGMKEERENLGYFQKGSTQSKSFCLLGL